MDFNYKSNDPSDSPHKSGERQITSSSTAATAAGELPDQSNEQNKKSMKRNSSLISFKSLDLGLKQIYSNMKNKHKDSNNSSGSKPDTASSSKTSITNKPPYLKVETVDRDSDENLSTFPQSPYSPRGSFDNNAAQYLSAGNPDYSRSTNNSPSPYLCINTPPNIRRSSTSDIIDKKPATSAADNRRPSTSDLLRRARERKGSESKGGAFVSNRMGRSVSQGGLPRGGRAGRRTSMAL